MNKQKVKKHSSMGPSFSEKYYIAMKLSQIFGFGKMTVSKATWQIRQNGYSLLPNKSLFHLI